MSAVEGLQVLGNLLCSIILFGYGYFAVFKPTQLIEYNIKYMGKRDAWYREKIVKKSWFYINMKICGIAMMLIALLPFYFSIHVLLLIK